MLDIWNKLSAPFDDNIEHALPQVLSVQKESARVAWYIDARRCGRKVR